MMVQEWTTTLLAQGIIKLFYFLLVLSSFFNNLSLPLDNLVTNQGILNFLVNIEKVHI